MKWTKVFIKTLCILCLVCFWTVGYVAESSGQLAIAVPNLATELPIDWRPKDGSSLTFRVKVTKPAHYSGGRLTATLSEVTNYHGGCGNRLSVSTYSGSIQGDLELRQDSSHNSGWRTESNLTSLSHPIAMSSASSDTTEWITLRVDCADYAAYGKLTFATTGSSIAEASPIVIKIPRDTNGNKIADGWRNDATTNYVASWDEESGPAAPNTQRVITLLCLTNIADSTSTAAGQIPTRMGGMFSSDLNLDSVSQTAYRG